MTLRDSVRQKTSYTSSAPSTGTQNETILLKTDATHLVYPPQKRYRFHFIIMLTQQKSGSVAQILP